MGSDGYDELPSWLPAHAGVTRSPPINCPRSPLAPRAHGRGHHFDCAGQALDQVGIAINALHQQEVAQ
jgi:hypothetical protein